MKKLITLSLITIFLSSCSSEIQTNVLSTPTYCDAEEAEVCEIDFSSFKEEKIKIASCPTCFEIAKTLSSEKFEIIKTASTSESVKMLKNNEVDYIISGRKLKKDEGNYKSIKIQDGYSFLSKTEFSIYKNDLKNFEIYTDQSPELIKNTFNIEKINFTENIYNFTEKGILITSWENTNFDKAEIVHIFENDSKRLKLSRQPTLYCKKSCDEIKEEILKLVKKA